MPTCVWRAPARETLEDAPGQFETEFAYAAALVMANRFTFFRDMVHEIARRHGYFASFMPKPPADRTGSAGHFNMSMADLRTGENLVRLQRRPAGLRAVEARISLHCRR